MDYEMAQKFFILFSKMECSLKRAKYFHGNADGVEVNWDKFANDLGGGFFARMRESKKLKEIFTRPPMVQIVEKERLEWKNGGAINNGRELLLAVRRIRNNLFHGGKYPGRPIQTPERNEALLADAMFILTEALRSNAEVQEYFRGIE